MRNEGEAHPTQAAACHGIQAEGLDVDCAFLRVGALTKNAVIVRSAGGLQLQRCQVSLLIEPVQGFFILLGTDSLFRQILAAAHGNEQENVVGYRAKRNRQGMNGRELLQVLAGDGGIDLKVEARLPGILHPAKRSLEGSRDLPEGVMGGCGSAIQADTDALDAHFLQPPGILGREQRPVHRHGHAEALLVSVSGNLEDIRTQQRFTAGQNDDGTGKGGNLIQEFKTLICGELILVLAVQGGSAAVNASQVTGAGHLPGDQTQIRLMLALMIWFHKIPFFHRSPC